MRFWRGIIFESWREALWRLENKRTEVGDRKSEDGGQNSCSLLFEDNNGIFYPNIHYGWVINICALDKPCSCVNKKGANDGCDNY